MDDFERFWQESYGQYQTNQVDDKSAVSILDSPDQLEDAYAAWESSWIDGPQP